MVGRAQYLGLAGKQSDPCDLCTHRALQPTMGSFARKSHDPKHGKREMSYLSSLTMEWSSTTQSDKETANDGDFCAWQTKEREVSERVLALPASCWKHEKNEIRRSLSKGTKPQQVENLSCLYSCWTIEVGRQAVPQVMPVA